MGLNAVQLRFLKPALMKAKRVLCLSYPDIVATGDEVKAVLGVTPTVFANTGSWHGKDFQLPETRHVFSLCGVEETRCVDVHASRGCEEIVDLNEPAELGTFDLVIDPGTSEHVFNVGQAIKTAAESVRYGGVIFHAVPLSLPNHGFWNFSPTAFADFYEQNGWKVELLVGIADGKIQHLHRRDRFGAPESGMICIARRFSQEKLRWPTQSKYLINPGLSHARSG